MFHQLWYRGLQIDQKVRFPDHGHHQAEQLHIGVVVPVGKVSHGFVVRNENMHALHDCPVLNYDFLAPGYLKYVLEPLSQEIGLQIV